LSKYKNTKLPSYKAQRRRMHINQRARRRVVLEELKSGGCVLCGYAKCFNALVFHHVDNNKEQKPSQIQSISSLIKEVSKCIVVCANCHAEIHAGHIENIEHIETVQLKEKKLPLLEVIEGGT